MMQLSKERRPAETNTDGRCLTLIVAETNGPGGNIQCACRLAQPLKRIARAEICVTLDCGLPKAELQAVKAICSKCQESTIGSLKL